MKKLLSLILILFSFNSRAQSLYFPPLSGTQWDTVDQGSTPWCWSCLDTVDRFLAQKNTKGFLILKDGKIAYERYYGTFTKDSLWYWASAGKTLTSMLIGIAQEKGLLNINHKTAQYLGQGWTSLTASQEDSITIRHQLTMTTGLDDAVPNDDCTDDTCLIYKAPVGTRWAYHNAPYLLLQSVLDSCSPLNLAQITNQWVKLRIGMGGTWFNGTYYSRLRDFARFGLLNLARGVWNGQPILNDTAYFIQATNTSQALNPSYGYLWWLNGKPFYRLPTTQLVFSGPLVPNAPMDMIAALGKNDQKIYVAPSMNIVVVRMGESAGQVSFALSSFDNTLWGLLRPVFQQQTSTHSLMPLVNQVLLQKNSDGSWLHVLPESWYGNEFDIFNLTGQKLKSAIADKLTWNHADWGLPAGIYLIKSPLGMGKLYLP